MSGAEDKENNAYDSFQGLLALARLTSSNADEARGACKKYGRVGHLTFQCRNFLSVKEDDVLQAIMEKENNDNNNNRNTKFVGADRARSLKNAVAPASGESFDEDEEESESNVTVSDEDSEIERIIAARFGNSHSKYKDIHKEKYTVSRVYPGRNCLGSQNVCLRRMIPSRKTAKMTTLIWRRGSRGGRCPAGERKGRGMPFLIHRIAIIECLLIPITRSG